MRTQKEIRDTIKRLGLKQTEIARRMGVSRQTLNEILNSEHLERADIALNEYLAEVGAETRKRS